MLDVTKTAQALTCLEEIVKDKWAGVSGGADPDNDYGGWCRYCDGEEYLDVWGTPYFAHRLTCPIAVARGLLHVEVE